MTLEQMNAFLRRAGVDPETGRKPVNQHASQAYLEAYERTMEAFTVLGRTLAQRGVHNGRR